MVKRKDLAKPLSALVDIGSKKDDCVRVDNLEIFIRLIIAIGNRVDSIESLFQLELTKTPASLFKGYSMRKTQKSALLKVLLPDVVRLRNANSFATTVVDGGALLHRLRWTKDTTFSRVAASYYEYIHKNYNNPKIFLMAMSMHRRKITNACEETQFRKARWFQLYLTMQFHTRRADILVWRLTKRSSSTFCPFIYARRVCM